MLSCVRFFEPWDLALRRCAFKSFLARKRSDFYQFLLSSEGPLPFLHCKISHLLPMALPRLLSASGGPNLNAQSLHAFLVSCTDDIVGACRAVEAFLQEQPSESALGFFRVCFPVLLQKVFGFQDSGSSSSSAWLVRATDEHSANALCSLLHPSGPLFSSLIALDREQAVQFVFPNERLPLRIRRLLLLDRGVSLLSQTSELFKNRIKVSNVGGVQLQLDLFEYYIFWFAYYAASCDDYGSFQSVSKPSRSFSHWVSGLHHTSNHDGRKPGSTQYGLYLQLLHFYLKHFIQSYHFTGMVHISGSTCLSQGGFLLLTLLEFWVMKDDLWPLQASQLGAVSVGFTHSGVELDAVRLIVNHSNSLLKACLDSHYGSCVPGALVGLSKGLGFESFSGSPLFASPTYRINTNMDYMQLLQRPLYRFITRALLYWPAGISVKQAWYIVDLWVVYMQPWLADTDERSGTNTGSNYSDNTRDVRGFSSMWQGYVTKNYPFYTSLVVHFLNFALKYIHANLELVLEMTAKVLGTLAGSKDLLDFLRKADHTHHTVFTKIEHGHAFSVDMDWEERISSSETKLADWVSCHAPQNKAQSPLFGAGEGGAFHAFQMLILQCEAEMQFVPSESQKTIYKALEFVKCAGVEIFSLNASSSLVTSKAETYSKPPMQNEVRALGRHTCFDVKYRGDWMRRPIESTEVAFLARLLVKLSDTINYKLNLTRDIDPQERSTPCKQTYHGSGGDLANATELDMAGLLRASRNSVVNLSFVELVQETRDFLLSCWNACCVWLRQRLWRVNLRFLAQKPLVVLLLMVLTLPLQKKF